MVENKSAKTKEIRLQLIIATFAKLNKHQQQSFWSAENSSPTRTSLSSHRDVIKDGFDEMTAPHEGSSHGMAAQSRGRLPRDFVHVLNVGLALYKRQRTT